jgi:hypothetical protein
VVRKNIGRKERTGKHYDREGACWKKCWRCAQQIKNTSKIVWPGFTAMQNEDFTEEREIN